jgi:ATP-dependent protease ClpP protease subunit
MPKKIRPLNKTLDSTWFSIKAPRLASGDVEVLLYGEIGWDVNAIAFREQLLNAVNAGASRVVVHINSVGGDMFESLAIYTILRTLSIPVVTYVDSLAASGGSLIAMAGNPVIMASGSFMMIHNPAVFVAGNQNDLANISDTVSLWAEAMAKIYAAKTGMSTDDIQSLMDAETWMDADRAVFLGFADKVDSAQKVAACLGLDKYSKVPEELLGSLSVLEKESQDEPVKERENVDKIGLAVPVAESETKAEIAEVEVDAEVAAVDNARAAMQADIAEISALCTIAGKPHLALEFITKNFSPAEVREALLADTTSKTGEVTTSVPAKEGAVKLSSKSINTAEIYKRWNSIKVRR